MESVSGEEWPGNRIPASEHEREWLSEEKRMSSSSGQQRDGPTGGWFRRDSERQTPAAARLPKSGHVPSEREGEGRVLERPRKMREGARSKNRDGS